MSSKTTREDVEQHCVNCVRQKQWQPRCSSGPGPAGEVFRYSHFLRCPAFSLLSEVRIRVSSGMSCGTETVVTVVSSRSSSFQLWALAWVVQARGLGSHSAASTRTGTERDPKEPIVCVCRFLQPACIAACPEEQEHQCNGRPVYMKLGLPANSQARSDKCHWPPCSISGLRKTLRVEFLLLSLLLGFTVRSAGSGRFVAWSLRCLVSLNMP